MKTKTEKAPAVKTEKPAKRKAEVNIAPNGNSLIPARFGSTQQKIIDMLARENGATLDELVAGCVRKDGANWSPASLMAGLYHHIPYKGYGIRTTFDDAGEPHYHIVLPEGVDAPAAPRRPRAVQNVLERMREFFVSHNTTQSLACNELTDEQLLEKFKNVTAAKEYVAKLENI